MALARRIEVDLSVAFDWADNVVEFAATDFAPTLERINVAFNTESPNRLTEHMKALERIGEMKARLRDRGYESQEDHSFVKEAPFPTILDGMRDSPWLLRLQVMQTFQSTSGLRKLPLVIIRDDGDIDLFIRARLGVYAQARVSVLEEGKGFRFEFEPDSVTIESLRPDRGTDGFTRDDALQSFKDWVASAKLRGGYEIGPDEIG